MRSATLALAAVAVATLVSTASAQFGESYFAIGGVYRDGRMSPGERTFRAVLKRRDAPAEFESMMHSFSRVRQLYGLLGLRLTDRAAFERELPAFLHRHDRVHTMSGCLGFDEPVADIAQRIARGTYDDIAQR
jgi:hypothetical protein